MVYTENMDGDIPSNNPSHWSDAPLDTTPEHYNYERAQAALDDLQKYSQDTLGVYLRIVPLGNPAELYQTVHTVSEAIKQLGLSYDDSLRYRRILFGLQCIAEAHAKVVIIDPFDTNAQAREQYRESLEASNPTLYQVYEEFNALRMNKIAGAVDSLQPLFPELAILDENFIGEFGDMGKQFEESFKTLCKEVRRIYKIDVSGPEEKVAVLEQILEEARKLFDTAIFLLRTELAPK